MLKEKPRRNRKVFGNYLLRRRHLIIQESLCLSFHNTENFEIFARQRQLRSNRLHWLIFPGWRQFGAFSSSSVADEHKENPSQSTMSHREHLPMMVDACTEKVPRVHKAYGDRDTSSTRSSVLLVLAGTQHFAPLFFLSPNVVLAVWLDFCLRLLELYRQVPNFHFIPV